MRRRLLIYSLMTLAAATAIVFLLHRAPAAEDEEVFRFAPPAGTIYDELLTKSTSVSYLTNSQVLVTKAPTSTKIEQDGENYRYLTIMGETTMTKNGAAAQSVAANLVKGLVLADLINAKGELTDIAGDDKFRAVIKEKASKETRDILLAAYGHGALLKTEQQNWQRRVGRFLGRAVKTGDQWVDAVELPLPDGKTVPAYRVTMLAGWMTVNGRRVFHIKVACSTSAETLAKKVGKTPAEILKYFPRWLPTTDIRVVSDQELLVDPATMLVYGEYSNTESMFPVELPDRTRVPMNGVEEKDYVFTYRQ